MREDSLQFVDYWSVDFHYDGAVFRPQSYMTRSKAGLETECAGAGNGRIAVRVVDIFGNSSLRVAAVSNDVLRR
jgi:hypothetical protein